MSKIMKLEEIELVNGKHLSLNSKYLRAGLKRLKNKGMFTEEEHEEVFELDDLLLEIYQLAILNNNYCENTNGEIK